MNQLVILIRQYLYLLCLEAAQLSAMNVRSALVPGIWCIKLKPEDKWAATPPAKPVAGVAVAVATGVASAMTPPPPPIVSILSMFKSDASLPTAPMESR